MDLEFEKPLLELEKKVNDLKKLSSEGKVDLSEAIASLEAKVELLKNDIYANLSAWDKVHLARHPHRPLTGDYIGALFKDFFELKGDRKAGDDPAIVGGLAKFHNHTVMILGHQKGKDTKENLKRNFGMPNPEGFRKAIRLMDLASKFSHPVITFIDTPGAFPGSVAEERGQYEAIASSIKAMFNLTVPVISLVIGEGGSGGAVGLGTADVVMMLENSVYSVITPEGCASIIWRDASKAREAAEKLRITAQDLKELKIIDEIIPEPRGGAHKDPQAVFAAVDEALARNLSELKKKSVKQLLSDRYQKFRSIGIFA